MCSSFESYRLCCRSIKNFSYYYIIGAEANFVSIYNLGNDVSGVYKYPQNCEKSNCIYFVEWKTVGENVHFTIITKHQDSISIGLSTAEHSVSLLSKNS